MAEPAIVKPPATYEDLCRVPEGQIAEILGGELVVSPRPAFRHARAAFALSADLDGPFNRRPGGPRGPGGWFIVFEPELHLGTDVVVPDIAGWRRERMPELPDAAYATLAPDWVCEILSPRSMKRDRVDKPPIYAREKVGFLWLLDPVGKTLEVLLLEGQYWVPTAVFQGDEKIRAQPFDAIELEMERWWEGFK
jgi:Uma2 family endonuclease